MVSFDVMLWIVRGAVPVLVRVTVCVVYVVGAGSSKTTGRWPKSSPLGATLTRGTRMPDVTLTALLVSEGSN